METLALATFAALLGVWVLMVRRRTVLRVAEERRTAGDPGFLRRLAS